MDLVVVALIPPGVSRSFIGRENFFFPCPATVLPFPHQAARAAPVPGPDTGSGS